MRFLPNTMRSRLAAGAAFGVLAVCVIAAAHPALAQSVQSAATQLATSAAAAGASTNSLPIIIAKVIRVFLGTLGIIFTIVVLYAGWIYMTAQGDDTKLKKAKDMIKNGVIGMILCIFSFTIASYILNSLLDNWGGATGSTSVADRYSEPLSGSLGAGIIESHYPERNAIGIPRNTRIMVTFKEPIDPASIISGYDLSPTSTDLNSANVLIYKTADEASVDTLKLGASAVSVTMNADHTIFVFDPVDLLGSSTDDTNYTVKLTNSIKKADKTAAFTASNQDGYEWTFEVSTEVDLTPPKVVSVIPRASATDARNITVSITFDEAMDPVAGTGTYVAPTESNPNPTQTFSNITVGSSTAASGYVDGTFSISNAYKTIEFTPTEACGVDPCGDTIYCLPAPGGSASTNAIEVTAKAASVGDEPPQADPIFVPANGLEDASANSLDGNGDDEGTGPDDDNYVWGFQTNDEINDTVPTITEMHPGILEGLSSPSANVTATFSVPMKSSTLNTTNVSLWADPWYEFWFTTSKTDLVVDDETINTTVEIAHPGLVSNEDNGWDYDPVITRDVKSAYQICAYPVDGPNAAGTGMCGTSTTTARYCCNGFPSERACHTTNLDTTLTTPATVELPDSNPESSN